MPVRKAVRFPLTIVFSLAPVLAAAQDPVINEFSASHAGFDAFEYVEVIGDASTDLSDLAIVQIDGNGARAGTINAFYPLGNTNAQGIWTAGFIDNQIANGSMSLLLVRDFDAVAGDDLDVDNDGTLDVIPWSEVLDGVAVDDGDAGDRHYADTVLDSSIDANPFPPGGASRIPDGGADWRRNNFNLVGLPGIAGGLAPFEAANTPDKSNTQAVPLPVAPAPLAIYEVQGARHLSAHRFDLVEVDGVVTAVDLTGFFLQEQSGDGNPATSDGIFIDDFGTGAAVGEVMRVVGIVNEQVPGGLGTGNLSVTEILSQSVTTMGNAPLPAAFVIGSSGVHPPSEIVISDDEIADPINLSDPIDDAANLFDPSEDAIDFYESLEGMRVVVEQPVAVSPIRVFGSASAEFFTLPNDGIGATPADVRTERGGINLASGPDNTGDQNPERVQIQIDGDIFGGPAPRVVLGDLLEDIEGVMGYSFGNYEVNATMPLSFRNAEPLIAPETSSLTPEPRHLTVATYNVLNLSPVSSDDEQREILARQIAENLNGPDIVALQEIQDNSGEVDDGTVEADETLDMLVDAIAAAGGPFYMWASVTPVDGETGGVPGGNIRNAFLYNPDRVTLSEVVGLRQDELAAAGVSDPTAFEPTRFPLLGRFGFGSAEVIIINNHFSSRFGSTPVFGGPQPFVQAAEAAREAQAQAMNDVVKHLLSLDNQANVIVLGDLNTFEFTDDLTEILPGRLDGPGLGPENRSGRPEVRSLLPEIEDDNRYTFNFEGNSQMLDHVFATHRLAQRAEFDIVHVNVDFPRDDNMSQLGDAIVGSDHEPILVRFKMNGL